MPYHFEVGAGDAIEDVRNRMVGDDGRSARSKPIGGY